MIHKLFQSKSLFNMFSFEKESITTDLNRYQEKCLKYNLKNRLDSITIPKKSHEIRALQYAYDLQQQQHIKSVMILQSFQELKNGLVSINEISKLSQKVKNLKKLLIKVKYPNVIHKLIRKCFKIR
ncbi:unnamed protein product [Paramecium sonneborni]|uniref:Uncharacterized protein n=1 Tax=Paramecium sonneborni TaxID=65129 RepID=A0A8S1KN31_9CILI|nr:unnamed protein product [Paramecium sonneborni]